MIQTIRKNMTITCDKCGKGLSVSIDKFSEVAFATGWVLQPKARKYHHLCFGCLTPKQKEANLFVRKKFHV